MGFVIAASISPRLWMSPFGLELDVKERTQWKIAKELGIGRLYVSRIEKWAFMKLYFYKAKR